MKKQKIKRMSVKSIASAGILLALAYVTSLVRIPMPMGGEITIFSMFFVCLIGYLYGVRIGFCAAFAFSIIQFAQTGASYFLSPGQVCCDYFFAFTALGISGIFADKKNGLVKGYVISCLVRGLFHTIGGYIYWMDYMPEWFPASLRNIYSIVYNYSYILAEMMATLLIINIKTIKQMIYQIKKNTD